MKKTRPQYVVMHFGELWLRGRNRGNYINTLMQGVRERLKGSSVKVEGIHDRALIRLGARSDPEQVCSELSKVFGLSGYELAYATKPTLASINAASKVAMRELVEEGAKGVRINATRSHKKFKFNSNDITKMLISTASGIGIEPTLEGYDSQLYVNVTKDLAFLSTKRFRGLGGLPVGTSGNGVVLLSGGIDSPVAAWYAMKRGIRPIYVHLHAFPDSKPAIDSKISSILKLLSRYSPHYKAYFVPSHYFQVAAAKSGRYELVLLKAFMLRLAERIADAEEASVIFTGESLGQVASQTSENLRAEQQGINVPVLRPLIGLDKQEIIGLAKGIGTYDESIKPYADVCSINSRHPVTMARVSTTTRLLGEIGIDKLVARSLSASATIKA
ncbi:MAG: tRNA 4-thiouridine(8) synthase ThiI [Candidatus Micrarchaeota archaeon]|nr:tRNA 4-thiouridine(8) synthase ThiI [Candidatus Micrarchaeota archaeon]